MDLVSILLVSRSEVMINRDSWGHSYSTVRGENLGFVKDGLLRKLCLTPRKHRNSLQTSYALWIPFGDHPLKLQRYRED